ncbi:MAG: hypothetical protein AB7G37_06250 [Solirubrobacteraceae bacterium]
MTDVLLVARLGLREAVRRRVLPAVLVLSLVFLVLFWLGVGAVRDELDDNAGTFGGVPDVVRPAVDEATAGVLLGMASFAVLFLGATLAVFLTAGAIRGDAERGLLQPLLVRPVGRVRVFVGRGLAAAAIAVPYALVLHLASTGVMRWRGDYAPPQVLVPAVELAAAVGLVALLALALSVLLTQTAAGIAAFMSVGAGLVGGLLGQIGDAIDNATLERASDVVSSVLPFQGLYQDVLSRLTDDDGAQIVLGPLGGAEPAGPGLLVWAAVWAMLLGGAALARFTRMDV